MTTDKTTLILGFVGVLCISACRDKPTCRDCEDAAEADDNDVIAVPDLPCDGADLMTDSLNCGTCGHECVLSYPGTEYVAGTCNEGVCGPGGWADCVQGPEETCSEVCVALGENCVPQGCAGLTGMMFDVLFGNGCGPNESEPLVTLAGGCDEPIPWMTPTENQLAVICCCDFQ